MGENSIINMLTCKMWSFILRMAAKILALWLLLAGTVFPQGCCQHWSYGLSPGGKRDLDNFSDTLGNVSISLTATLYLYISSCCFSLQCFFIFPQQKMVEEFPRVEAPCSVFGCAEESPFAKMYRVKGLLVSFSPE